MSGVSQRLHLAALGLTELSPSSLPGSEPHAAPCAAGSVVPVFVENLSEKEGLALAPPPRALTRPSAGDLEPRHSHPDTVSLGKERQERGGLLGTTSTALKKLRIFQGLELNLSSSLEEPGTAPSPSETCRPGPRVSVGVCWAPCGQRRAVVAGFSDEETLSSCVPPFLRSARPGPEQA